MQLVISSTNGGNGVEMEFCIKFNKSLRKRIISRHGLLSIFTVGN